MFQTAEYDAVVTDFARSDINGAEVTRQIRELRHETPIIVISGWHESQVLQEFQLSERPTYVIYKVDMAAKLPDILTEIRDGTKNGS